MLEVNRVAPQKVVVLRIRSCGMKAVSGRWRKSCS